MLANLWTPTTTLIRWKQAPDTMTPPADTPIHPIQQARLELVLNEPRHYWSEETVQAPLH